MELPCRHPGADVMFDLVHPLFSFLQSFGSMPTWNWYEEVIFIQMGLGFYMVLLHQVLRAYIYL